MAPTWSAEDDRTLATLHRAGIDTDEIARILHRSPAAVRTRLRKTGVTSADGVTNTKTSRKMCPGCGDYFESRAQSCSRKCAAAVRGRRSRGRPNARGARSGKRTDLDGLFVRSRWEANYARYLKRMKVEGKIFDWEYEPHTFQFPVKRGNKSYTPDFKVWITKVDYEWHEVKGWMDKDSRIKLERFERHHPQEAAKLQLIDKKVYGALEASWADEIDHWEPR